MLGQKIRPITKNILEPIGKALHSIDPNYVTAFSILLAIATGYLIIEKNYLLAGIMLILTSFMDMLDGAIAKSNNKKTKFGSYFDAMADRLVEIILFLSFAYIGYWFESMLAITFSMLVSYAKARAEMVVSLNNMDWPSIGERAERILFLILLLLIAPFYNEQIIGYGLLFLAIISMLGSIQRMLFAKKYLSKEDNKK